MGVSLESLMSVSSLVQEILQIDVGRTDLGSGVFCVVLLVLVSCLSWTWLPLVEVEQVLVPGPG